MPRSGRKRHSDEFSPEVLREIEAYHRHREGVAGSQGDGHIPDRPGGVELAEVVATIAARGDGLLRIVPRSEDEIWYTFQFTKGRWADHYLAVVQTARQNASELWRSLAGKLDLVDEGKLKPSPDKYAQRRK